MKVDPNAPLRLAELPAASPAEQAARNRAIRDSALRRLVQVKILADIFAGPQGGGHVAGDVAGFEQGYAEGLVKAGLASYDLEAGPTSAPRRVEMANGAPTAAAAGGVTLRLRKPWAIFMPGDCAGFNPDLARELIVKGIAEPVDLSRPKRTMRMIRDAIMRR